MDCSGKISVIVPVYRVGQYLEQCVCSLVSQTYADLEILLVDDGSPDCCPALCDEWAKRDARIRVIHKENGGLSDARNAGIEAASGRYIGFVDADDWIAPQMYERLYQAMTETDSDIAACGVEMIWDESGVRSMLTREGACVLDTREAMRAIVDESWLKQPVWYKLYKRDVIGSERFPVGKYHEDVFFSYRVIGNARRVAVFDESLYKYRQRCGSIMAEQYSLKRLNAIEAYCERQAYLDANYPELSGAGRYRLWQNCLYHGQLALRHLPEERGHVLAVLRDAMRKYPIPSDYLAGLPAKQKVFMRMAACSLEWACSVRNLLKIGL